MKNWTNNPNNNLWTQDEVELILDGDLSNEEISRITGRTIIAVRKKRYFLNAPYRKSEESIHSEIIGEARILDACKRLRVRLADCGD